MNCRYAGNPADKSDVFCLSDIIITQNLSYNTGTRPEVSKDFFNHQLAE